MLKLKIDNKEVKVPRGITVLAAARMQGADVPSMCYREGKEHFTSCMICMVKDGRSGKLFPSCSVKVEEGMELITRDDEVVEARRMALELLLSEHVGDCEAPCQITCPAHMDIPLMNRLLAEGKILEALAVVKKDIAMPAVFGRVCPAPCEGACKRKSIDSAVSICLLKRFAGDSDLDASFVKPVVATDTGKKVCVIGAGPAGLAAAYYLRLQGHAVELIDKNEFPGGTFWKEVEAGVLPKEVLMKEIVQIEGVGVVFSNNKKIDRPQFERLEKEMDAVVIAAGGLESVADWGLEVHEKGLVADKESFRTSREKVFAVGSVLRPTKLAIRCHGQGKDAAMVIGGILRHSMTVQKSGIGTSKDVDAYRMSLRRFNSRFGKLRPEEFDEYLKESVAGDRVEPNMKGSGFTVEQVMAEAARCLHCDCRDASSCLLRKYSDEYNASQKHYWSEDRKLVSKCIQHEFVIYEPAKCIKCGKCVHTTEEHKEKYGMSFIGRGFDVVIGVPFGESMSEGLKLVAQEVIEGCPTGALSARE